MAMTVLWPWGFLALPLVALAAAWAMRRPALRITPVSSLTLWAKALEALPASAARSARRVTAAWVLLLCGAAAAALALAGPMWQGGGAARRVAVAVCPSAELGEQGEAALRGAAAALLDRLDAADRVVLVLPTALGGGGDPVTPAEAAARVAKLSRLPAAAAELTVPAAADVQHTYRFVAATLPADDGPHVTTVALPARPGAVTLDALAAEPVGAPTGGVEVLAAVRNHSGEAKTGDVEIVATDAGDGGRWSRRYGPGRRGSGRNSTAGRLAGWWRGRRRSRRSP